MRLQVAGVSVVIDDTPIVSEVDLVVEPGEVVGVVGPNGSGKSTLLRAIYRALRPIAGTVHAGDADVWATGPRAAARMLAAMPQETVSDLDFSVVEVVLQGRTPHKRLFQQDDDDDWDLVAAALQRVGMAAHAGRAFATLSGGEKQRVLLARALTQEASALVLDEPTNHLDIAAQLDLLELVRDLGVTTIIAVHDLNHAAAYCDRVYVLDGGRVVACGPTQDVLTPELIAAVFRARAVTITDATTGRRQFAFSPLRHEVRTS